MIKLNKKQRKALRHNGKYHARKHGEHRRRISRIVERLSGEFEPHYICRSYRRYSS